jgi:hypothetical protein
MSNVNNLLDLIKNNLEVELIPIGIGALQILEKDPSALGVGAAEAYILGNAPAALLSGATSLLQQEVTALSTNYSAALAKLQALQSTVTPKPVGG